MQHQETHKEALFKFVVFLFNPILGVLFAFLRNINSKSSYVIFFLFAIFFGMSFNAASNKTSKLGRFDGADYRIFFENSQLTTFSEYKDGFVKFIEFDEGSKDYYFQTLSFFVSRFTDNYHVMFLIAAAIFAFFALKSFRFLTSETKFNISLAGFILAYLFMYNGIFNINGVRFWTAAWVGVYSIFQIFRNNNIKYFLLAFLTPFFHGAYWFFVGILVLAYLLKRFEKLWVVLFIISFFVSSIAIELITSYANLLPTFLERMVESYTDEFYVELRSQVGGGFSWVARVFDILVRVYINFMVFLFIINSKYITLNKKTKKLYQFLLVYMSFVNFVMPVPSLGIRFIILAYPIIAYIWLVSFKGVKYKYVLYALPFVFFMNIYEQIKLYSMVIEPLFLYSNPFYLIYHYLIA